MSVRLLLLLVLSGVTSASVGQQQFGRLFSTVEERLLLEERRREREFADPVQPVEPSASASATTNEKAEPVVSQLAINGYVIRSNGKGATWLNGRQVYQGGMTREGIQVHAPDGIAGYVKITLPSIDDTIQLKPGQKVDVASGDVLESYQDRETAESPRNAFEAAPADEGEGGPVADALQAATEAVKNATDVLRAVIGGE